MTVTDQTWMPQACTLPTGQRPLRPAEFDEVFATALRGQQRITPTPLRWQLVSAVEAQARGLTIRQSSCRSFLTFAFAPRAAAGMAA